MTGCNDRSRAALWSEANPARLAAWVVQPRLRDLDPHRRRSFVSHPRHALLHDSRHAMFSSSNKRRSTPHRGRRRRRGRGGRPARSEVRTRRALERIERRTHQRGRRPGAEPVIRERAARDRPGRGSSSPRHAPPAGVIVCAVSSNVVTISAGGRGRDEVRLRGPLEPDAPLRVVRQSPDLDVELRVGRQIDRFLPSERPR